MSFIEQTDEVVEPEWDEDPGRTIEASVGEEASIDEAAVDEEVGASDEAVEESSTHALFDGDDGGLELDERRTLVVLLKNRFITSESHPREWRTLVLSRHAISRRLNDLFLELKYDPKREVAYKRAVSSDTGGRDFPTLLHDTIWQREETALLVYLRVRARNEEVRGELHARVSQAELLEHLRENRPESATNQVADDRRAERAVNSLKSAGLLVRTDDDGVFKISPAIETMLPMPTLVSLLSWLHVRTERGPVTDDEPATEERS